MGLAEVAAASQPEVVAGSWRLDPQGAALVAPDGERHPLTRTSLRVLELLMSQPGRVWRSEEIMRWAYDGGGTASQVANVRAMIRRIRHQAGAVPIRARHGLGYCWAEEEEICQPRG